MPQSRRDAELLVWRRAARGVPLLYHRCCWTASSRRNCAPEPPGDDCAELDADDVVLLLEKSNGEESEAPDDFLMEERRLAAERELRRIPGMVLEVGGCVSLSGLKFYVESTQGSKLHALERRQPWGNVGT